MILRKISNERFDKFLNIDIFLEKHPKKQDEIPGVISDEIPKWSPLEISGEIIQ